MWWKILVTQKVQVYSVYEIHKTRNTMFIGTLKERNKTTTTTATTTK